jgi:methylenetetrahydrofolate dehydrogenase (NADP+)/methenyltetrahydrofolate cyclohydrolase
MPLPENINPTKIINVIDPIKDVDGFHPVNLGNLMSQEKTAFIPCTPLGCLYLIKQVDSDLTGKNAVVIGRSITVGKPVANLLTNNNATVTLAHSKTKNLKEICLNADILVAAVGKPEFIKHDFIKKGAIVIDVGINRIKDSNGKNKLVGDVEFEKSKDIAKAITPVPGGVGPMTIAYLMSNTLKAFKLQNKN